MGVLSGNQIEKLVNQGKLVIDPFVPSHTQPASYDLRVGSKILASPTGPEKLGKIVILTKEKPVYSIESGQMVGVISFEKISVPLDLCGRFGIRSSFARKGINAFGGLQLDPGFKGRLILNLLNVGPEPVPIKLGDLLFTIEFERLDEPAESPYSGPYQEQDDFPEDQYNYIISAHTTSLAEIPALRMEISRLSNVIEELEESLPDPDEGLELKPEIKSKLARSLNLPRESLISLEEMKRRLKAN
ncbi:MAG: dCTP deaminase [bacterium]|nr:dCTP deaminase [bacterium]